MNRAFGEDVSQSQRFGLSSILSAFVGGEQGYFPAKEIKTESAILSKLPSDCLEQPVRVPYAHRFALAREMNDSARTLVKIRVLGSDGWRSFVRQ
jgi:hypothetical protein